MRKLAMTALIAVLVTTVGCGKKEETRGQTTTGQPGQSLSGIIRVDGSSTVFPITEAVAEEFQKLHRGV